jgi:hypothetical protein
MRKGSVRKHTIIPLSRREGMNKQFSIADVISRAFETGIVLDVAPGGKLQIDAAPGSLTPRAQSVLDEYRVEIVEALTHLCLVCLDQGRETAAYHLHNNTYYCATHLPRQESLF